MLYNIFIYPIEFIIEFSYSLLKRIVGNPALAIIGVSIAVQILTLPLYAIAEKWQQIERDTQAKLKPKVDKIKAAFKGDEQYMILSTFYKQNNYHPIFALRSTLGLLIQVPFFIAAYTFLSNLASIRGSSFYLIQDLGLPDGLLSLGAVSINLLPILMTIINVISSAIYTKGFSFREKSQLYIMAALFLFLLYNSPSALVLYWTLNNLFSLIKNVISKAKNPLKLFYIVSCTTITIVAGYYLLFVTNQSTIRKLFVCTMVVLILIIPLLLKIINLIIKYFLFPLLDYTKSRTHIVVLSCVSLFILLGIFIPSSLIASSAQEFSFIDIYSNPLYFIQFPLFKSAGLFLFWIPLLFTLFSTKTKSIISWILLSLLAIVIFQTFIFIGDFGLISSTLQFETGVLKMPTLNEIFLDGIVIGLSLLIALLLIRFSFFKLITPILAITCVSLFFLSIFNVVSIQNTFSEYEKHATSSKIDDTEQIYNFSKTEKNVIIIMLDRAISSFIPLIFQENPIVKEQYAGFTYYPNTVSVNGHTLMGSPPLYGGYEYLPTVINNRNSESLVSKHNEALSVLPVLFSENGYTTTITDASWANYSYIPDNRIFSKWPDIIAKNMSRTKTLEWTTENNIPLIKQSALLKRNLFFFSIFRALPSSLKGVLYDNGKWWEEQTVNPDLKNYIDHFSVLDYLPKLTNTNSKTDSFNLIVSEATHNSLFLQYPEYKPSNIVTDTGINMFNDEYTHKSYHVNVGPIKAIGEYFDFLRNNSVYDNTRIIIVSDHGITNHHLPIFDAFTTEKDSLYPEGFHSLLMVKDFNNNEPIETDASFMTNADIPFLATEGIIKNAINPFSGAPFSVDAKLNGIDVYITPRYTPEQHNKNTFILDGETWHVKDNIFEPSNWSKIQ